MSEEQESIEHEVFVLFENAERKLKKINEEVQGKKSQVVIELARDLEGKIPTDTICNEIVKRLPRSIASERLIRDCLDLKYKQKEKAEIARKQKKKKIQESSDGLAASMPLKLAEGKTIVVAHNVNGKSTEEYTSNQSSNGYNLPLDNNTNIKPFEQVGLDNQLHEVLPASAYTWEFEIHFLKQEILDYFGEEYISIKDGLDQHQG